MLIATAPVASETLSVADSLRAEATVTGLAHHKARTEENKMKWPVELIPTMMKEANKKLDKGWSCQVRIVYPVRHLTERIRM